MARYGELKYDNPKKKQDMHLKSKKYWERKETRDELYNNIITEIGTEPYD